MASAVVVPPPATVAVTDHAEDAVGNHGETEKTTEGNERENDVWVAHRVRKCLWMAWANGKCFGESVSVLGGDGAVER